MSKQSRVMWSEGMFLLPQHFQYQDEFHQHQLLSRHCAVPLSIGGYKRCRSTKTPWPTVRCSSNA